MKEVRIPIDEFIEWWGDDYYDNLINKLQKNIKKMSDDEIKNFLYSLLSNSTKAVFCTELLLFWLEKNSKFPRKKIVLENAFQKFNINIHAKKDEIGSIILSLIESNTYKNSEDSVYSFLVNVSKYAVNSTKLKLEYNPLKAYKLRFNNGLHVEENIANILLRNKKFELLKYLIQNKYPLEFETEGLGGLLYSFSGFDADFDAVKFLVENNILTDIHTQEGYYGDTPLTLAICYGNRDIIKYFEKKFGPLNFTLENVDTIVDRVIWNINRKIIPKDFYKHIDMLNFMQNE